jgi:bifunctional UDP-N-acetylglucosamine pyrophosphorylase/glucosamine-1-phosphate N-acetyltransferase
MKSSTPKILHQICGRTMIEWVTEAVSRVRPDRLLVVLASDLDEVHQFLPQEAEVVIQEKQLGTGDAVRVCEPVLEGFEGDIMVLYGDTPLVTGEELAGLAVEHGTGTPACTLMTVAATDPSHYGRVCRDFDGRIVNVVEHRDATQEQLAVCEINAGVYIFEAATLWEALSQVGDDNDQGEVYLTDVIGIMSGKGLPVLAFKVEDEDVTLGVNSRPELARATAIMQRRILEHHMLNGVTVRDPATAYVDHGVKIGRDTVIEPMTMLLGSTIVGEECIIGPSSTVVDTSVEEGARLIQSHAVEAAIGAGCSVGPFAYLRPGATLAAGAKAGSFVEIKNSTVGEGAKVPHLSYIGDAEIGAGTNIGAGNITANYDGVDKHRTVIGSGVHTGADTTFVAPVTVGDGAMTGAGSVITGDIPAEALGIARCRQKNIESYASRKPAAKKGEGDRED